MSKVTIYILATLISVTAMACGGNKSIDTGIATEKIVHYVNSNNLDSLKTFGDSISVDKDLCKAILSQFKDSTIALSSATMAIVATPQEAAQITLDDIRASSGNKGKVSFLKMRTRALFGWYNDLGQPNNVETFNSTLDSLTLQLDIDTQAKCYVTVATTPAFLAEMVNNHSENEKSQLITAIENAYGDNSTELTQFRNNLKK